MSDVSPNILRGFLRPMDLSDSDIWQSESTITFQSVRPAQPRPSGDYKLVVTSSGDKPSSTPAVITTDRSGTAGDANGATFLWKEEGGSNYGYDIGGAISGFEPIQVNDVTYGYKNPDSLTLSNGNSLVVYERFTVLSSTSRLIALATRDRESGTWTTQNLLTVGVYNNALYPCICELPNGDLLIAFWVAKNTDECQIGLLRSTDKGANWTQITQAALTTPLSTKGSSPFGFTPKRMRMCGNEEHVLIVAELLYNDSSGGIKADRMGQFASSNMGASFSTVGITGGSGAGVVFSRYKPDCFVDKNGFFRVLYMRTIEQVYMFTLPNAYYDVTTLDGDINATLITDSSNSPIIADPITYGSTTRLDGELSCWRDDEGSMFVALRNVSTSITYEDSLFLRVSRDGGETWHNLNNSGSTVDPIPFYWINDAQTIPVDLSGSSSEGRHMIVSTHDASPATQDNSISALYLGGYSTRTLHTYVELPKWYQHGALPTTWIPIEKPQDTPIYTTTGTGSDSLSNLALEITTSIPQPNKYYQVSPTTTPAQGFVIHCGFKTVSGYGSDYPVIHLRTNDGSAGYELKIRVSSSNLIIRDEVAGASLATAAVSTTGLIELLIALKGDSITVYYQTGTASGKLKAKKNYSSITGTLTSDGGGGTGSFIHWGHVPVAAVARVSSWSWFNYAEGALTGGGIDNETPIEGRLYPLSGSNVYVYDGLSISTKDGPAFTGDQYTIEQDSDYPFNRIFPAYSYSPRVQYRSAAVASGAVSELYIPFHVDQTVQNAAASSLGGDLIAIHLNGINFQNVELYYYNVGTTAWVQYESTIDLADGLSFTFSRTGSTITAGSPTIDEIYLYHDEAKDWILKLGSNTYRRIVSNTEGLLTNTAGKKAVLKLEGVDNGADPTSGTAYIIPSSATITANLLGVEGSAWALKIPSQETIDKYFTIGSFLLGVVEVQAPQYGRGRSLTYETNTEIYESPDLGLRTRKRSEGRRTLSVSWSSGVSMHDYYGASLDPDYWTASSLSGAQPVAAVNDVAYQMEGLYRYLEGARIPTVYLPKIQRATTSALKIQVHNRREAHLYCYLDSPITYENILGDEMDNEVLRIGSLTLREII